MPVALIWIVTALVALVSGGGLRGLLPQLLGKDPIDPSTVGLQRYVSPNTVLVTTDPATGQQTSIPISSAPGGALQDAPKPAPSSVAKDLVNTPWSMWGLAALGFVSVFLINQVRAAAHEAGTGVKTLYDEGKAQTANLKEGGDTANQSRYAKKRSVTP